MTHDVPGDEGGGRRWCENCRIGVEPVTGERGPECPNCGWASADREDSNAHDERDDRVPAHFPQNG